MLLKSAGDDADGGLPRYNSLESTYEDGFLCPRRRSHLACRWSMVKGVRTLYDAFNGSKLVLMTEVQRLLAWNAFCRPTAW